MAQRPRRAHGTAQIQPDLVPAFSKKLLDYASRLGLRAAGVFNRRRLGMIIEVQAESRLHSRSESIRVSICPPV